MKKQTLILLFLFPMLLACSLLQPTPPSPIITQATLPAIITATLPEQLPIPTELPAPTLFDIPWDDRTPYIANLNPQAVQALDEQPGASVYHIKFLVNDDASEVRGQVEVRYENRESQPLDEIQLRLFPNILGGQMTLHSEKLNGQDVTPLLEMDDSLARIAFNPPLAPGQQAVVSLAFTTRVPPGLDENYGVLSNAEGVLAYAHGYPMVAVFNDGGWNAEIPPQAGDVTFSDASYYIVSITAPENLVIAAAGSELGREVADGQQTVTYALGPARDFFFAASEDYVIFSESSNGVAINVFAPSKFKDRAQASLGYAKNALDIFSNRYAAYPYSELDIATTPTLALGIEYPGIIALTGRILDASGDYPNSYVESVTAHEAAHQWFYNLVGNDQLDEPWLDESLSQFATWQYFLDGGSPAKARSFYNSLQNRWERVEYEEIPVGMPVRDYSDLEYSAIVYGRGALFFEDLKTEMGQENFDRFMLNYTEKYSWEIATTEGLKSTAEMECSCDLTALFEKWIYP